MSKNIAVLLSFFVFSGSLQAQQKYGHINSMDILHAMPEYKQLQAAVANKQQQQQNLSNAMYLDLQKRQKELQDLGPGLMIAVQEEKLRELDSLQQAISAFESTAADNLQSYQAKLLKPMNDKYLKILDAVAKENGYTYIFDVSTGTIAYYPETTGDITELVKKKMGIK